MTHPDPATAVRFGLLVIAFTRRGMPLAERDRLRGFVPDEERTAGSRRGSSPAIRGSPPARRQDEAPAPLGPGPPAVRSSDQKVRQPWAASTAPRTTP